MYAFHAVVTIAGVAASLASALPCYAPAMSGVVGKAVYFQTNTADNLVIAVPIMANGTLWGGKQTATGGSGLSFINSATNQSAGPDSLSSQGSVVVSGQNLFVVNSGSNTLSMFSISPYDPTDLTLVGEPVAVPGDFPSSVTVSPKNGIVCVATTGELSGIACAPYAPEIGIGSMDFLRSFDLEQSNPPMGPLNMVGQTAFSADESVLLTTVKGDSATNKTGFVSIFSVSSGCGLTASRVSAVDSRTSISGMLAYFGFQSIPQSSNIFVTDASFGAAVLSTNEMTEKAALIRNQTIPDQQATCWATLSEVSQSAFVSDPVVNHIVEMSLADASIIATYNTSQWNSNNGYIDLQAAGNYLYALSPGNKSEILVMDLSAGKGQSTPIQTYDVTSLGASKSAQGMQVLMKPQSYGA